MQRWEESFRDINVQEDKMPVDENGILNTISIDGALHVVPSNTSPPKANGKKEEQPGRPGAPNVTTSAEARSKTPKAEATDTIEPGDPEIGVSTVFNDAKDAMKYTVEKIVWHTEKNKKAYYNVRWYWYTSMDSSVKPPEDLPLHFVKSFGGVSDNKRRTHTRVREIYNRQVGGVRIKQNEEVYFVRSSGKMRAANWLKWINRQTPRTANRNKIDLRNKFTQQNDQCKKTLTNQHVTVRRINATQSD